MSSEKSIQKNRQKRPSLSETFGIDKSSWTVINTAVVLSAAILMIIGGILHFTGGDKARTGDASQNPSAGGRDSINTSFNQQDLTGILDGFLTNSFPSTTPAPGSGSGRQDSPEQTSTPSAPENMNEWSPAFLRGGAGLFIGFCVGFAIRSFVKLGAVILGFYMLSLMMLSWMGWIEIHFPVIDAQLGNFSRHFTDQFESFKTFLAGSIPTTGVTAAGFYAGIRKR